jgi:hypothetical protein
MMRKAERYRQVLSNLAEWDSFLLEESGLPGPRGNLELAQAVADEGDEETFLRFAAYDSRRAPTNSPYEFLAFCGVVGLGRLVAEGSRQHLPTLRRHASDPRWRIREAVVMALQRFGRVDMQALLQEMVSWSQGNLLEKRAAAAALCEPSLLGEETHARRVLGILDEITASIQQVEDRRSDEFRTLRKGLGYCWSVAVAALPQEGKAAMEKWLSSDDRDVRWIMKENLKKKRLVRIDAAWVEVSKVRLEAGASVPQV